MNNRKPEPARAWDHPERTYRWTDAELAWIAKRDAQWAAWGYSLAPLTPAPEPVRESAREGPQVGSPRGALRRALGALLR